MNHLKPETVDFQALVNNNSNKLSLHFQSKMVDKLKENFNDNEQGWFVANLYVFLNYHPTNEFPINLENVFAMIGFANKGNAKRTLESNFTLNEDYKILLLPKDKQMRGGHNDEKIMLNVDTFKNLCMMVKTEKGKQIRKYYVKLENIFNELIQEERKFYELQIEEKDKLIQEEQESSKKLLEEKDKYIAQLKDQESISILYIAHNTVIKNVHKIGISSKTSSNDILVRGENHKSSNPQFESLFTYETPNAKLIEDFIKLLLKPFKLQKPEWFTISYHRMKQLVDFGIMMYENYHVHESVDNLSEFISRYKSNRLINTNKARIMIERNIYEDYVKENMVYGENLKVSTELIADDFHKWFSDKYPSKVTCSHIKLETGNYSTEFRKELITTIASITEIDYSSKVSCSNRKRGIHFSNCGGFVGMEIRAMNQEIVFFEQDVYKTYIDTFIKISNNPRHKVSRKEIIEHFLMWIKNENYKCHHIIMCRTTISDVFKKDLCKNLENLTGLKIQDVCKINQIGCFVGMEHSYFPFVGNETHSKPDISIEQKIENQIDKWIDPENKSYISTIFKTILNNNYFISEKKTRDLMKNSYFDFTLNKKKHNWHYIFKRHTMNDETGFSLTQDALDYYNNNYE
jgi:phage anti-repressor protein